MSYIIRKSIFTTANLSPRSLRTKIIKSTLPTNKDLESSIERIGGDIIVSQRNQIALEAIDATLSTSPNANFVLIWGAGHLRGLGQGLRERGFNKTNEQYLEPFTDEDLQRSKKS